MISVAEIYRDGSIRLRGDRWRTWPLTCEVCCNLYFGYPQSSVCSDCRRGDWGRAQAACKIILKRAKQRGVVPPHSEMACVDCGGPAYGYDHRDYSKPLDVVPICRRCNKLRGPAVLSGAVPEARQ